MAAKVWSGEKILTAMPPKFGCITVEELARKTGIKKRLVVMQVSALSRRGLVVHVRVGCYRRTPLAEKLIEQGKPLRSGPKGPHGYRAPRDTLRTRAWKALRMLTKATVPELLELAATGDEKTPADNLQKYLAALERVGVVQRLARREAGLAPTSNGFLQWLLVRDLGALAPRWSGRDDRVFDLNAKALLEKPAAAPAEVAP